MWLKDMAEVLKNTFNPQGFNVLTDEKAAWKLKMKSWFDSSLKFEISLPENELHISNQKSKDELGVEYTDDIEQELIEMA